MVGQADIVVQEETMITFILWFAFLLGLFRLFKGWQRIVVITIFVIGSLIVLS